jgi:maleylpyruvate isomerase
MDDATLEELQGAEDRLRASLNGLDDAGARAASRLPGWTRGHVLTHLARNADGLGNLVTWATTGVVTPMYLSREARSGDIEAGSGRPAGELVGDLEVAASQLRRAFAAMSDQALEAVVEIGPSRTATLGAELPLMRVRELEIHHVDLDLGYEPGDWSTGFSTRTLDQLAPRFRGDGQMPVAWLTATDTTHRWRVADVGDELHGTSVALVAWLTGRTPAADAASAGLELAGGGPVPSAPPWL